MITVRESHTIHLPEARFWAVYADPEMQRRMLVEGLGYGPPRFLEVDDRGGVRTWRAEVEPRIELPAAVARLVGGRMLYTESATVDPAGRSMSLRHVTRALGDRLALSGEIRTTPRGAAAVERQAVFTVQARIPGLGRLLERSSADNIRRSLAATARWLDGLDGG